MPTVLELYGKLKPKLGEEETRALLEFVETSIERRAATKEDLRQTGAELREEIRKTEAALKGDIRQVEGELREEIQRLEGELRKIEMGLRSEIHRLEGELQKMGTGLRGEIHRLDQKIDGAKVELLQWTFGFWVGNIAVLSGIMFALFRAFIGT